MNDDGSSKSVCLRTKGDSYLENESIGRAGAWVQRRDENKYLTGPTAHGNRNNNRRRRPLLLCGSRSTSGLMNELRYDSGDDFSERKLSFKSADEEEHTSSESSKSGLLGWEARLHYSGLNTAIGHDAPSSVAAPESSKSRVGLCVETRKLHLVELFQFYSKAQGIINAESKNLPKDFKSESDYLPRDKLYALPPRSMIRQKAL